ncbi:MAG TPA: polymorphic toxin type 44 domain-containing protein, partial [Herpetosiphonaceae bacterium]
ARFHVPWKRIARANREVIGNHPNLIRRGQKLVIPCDEGGTGGIRPAQYQGNSRTVAHTAARVPNVTNDFVWWLNNALFSLTTDEAKSANEKANRRISGLLDDLTHLPPRFRGAYRRVRDFVTSKITAYKVFINYVRPSGYWDIKRKEPYSNPTGRVKLCGTEMDFDAPGNILYGYAGKLASFSSFELRGGSMAVQILSSIPDWLVDRFGGSLRTINRLANELNRDQPTIGVGIRLQRDLGRTYVTRSRMCSSIR